jgi:hypothetical protein
MKFGSSSPPSLLRYYLWFVGAALLVQGTISLLLILAGIKPLGSIAQLLTADRLHAIIHIGWGIAILRLLRMVKMTVLGFSFGGFYLILGLLGVTIDHPLGMRLRTSEHLFHLVVGVAALLLSWQTLKWKRDRHFDAQGD